MAEVSSATDHQQKVTAKSEGVVKLDVLPFCFNTKCRRAHVPSGYFSTFIVNDSQTNYEYCQVFVRNMVYI